MKNFIIWLLGIIITLGAAYYQRKSGPTYPKRITVELNDSTYYLKLVRSLGIEERPEVKLGINDTTIKARLYFKRLKSQEDYQSRDFVFRVYPVNSPFMNKVFKITEEKGLYADVPVQPAAGKLQYYIELSDSKGTRSLFKENPVVIRFKGSVPGYILAPHILFMFLAMLFSTVAGLMALFKNPRYKKYGIWTLVILFIGGMILGPLVQKFAFGELWTGVPFGWDLTDNKTLIALIFWIIAVLANRKKESPALTFFASVVLIVIFSIPHSLFGSELDYESGKVIQGFIFLFSAKIPKIS